jgi:hypothetical protein
VHNLNLYVDIFGLDYVYQIVDKNNKIVYYGITKRDPIIRGNEHINSGKLRQGEKMQVIAKDVNHDQARTIEATLIRDRLEASDAGNDTSIAGRLEVAGLRNQNRGRDVDNRPYDPDTMGGEIEMLEEPENVEGLNTDTCKE